MRVLPLLPAASLAAAGGDRCQGDAVACLAGVACRSAGRSRTLTFPTNFLAHLGRAIFRHDTFADEQLWTGVLRMHEPIATLTPRQALAVGLKVDWTRCRPPSWPR